MKTNYAKAAFRACKAIDILLLGGVQDQDLQIFFRVEILGPHFERCTARLLDVGPAQADEIAYRRSDEIF